MSPAKRAEGLAPRGRPSPWPGYECLRGYSVPAVALASGHVLALHVFPENEFAPYRTVHHRTPDGDWAIYVDGVRIDTACPRYFGAAAEFVDFATIDVEWSGATELIVRMDEPPLEWRLSLVETPVLRVVNALDGLVPERTWRWSAFRHMRERFGRSVLGLGHVEMAQTAPSGQAGVMMPRRIYLVRSSTARLDGRALGEPVRGEQLAIGSWRLPARGFLAFGNVFFALEDADEYRRIIDEIERDPVMARVRFGC